MALSSHTVHFYAILYSIIPQLLIIFVFNLARPLLIKHINNFHIINIEKKEMKMKLKKKTVLKEDKRKIKTFIWPLSGNANEVFLAGDFNGWKPEPMAKGETGFHGTVKLEPGVYQYKFVVDGEWQVDPSAMENAQNDFGTANSILRLG